MIRRFVTFALIMLLIPVMAMAQDTTIVHDGEVRSVMFTADLICLIAGPIIAMIVQALKNVEIFYRWPKVTALALSVISAIVSGMTFAELDWAMIATCVLGPFATAVATYEVYKTTKESVSGSTTP